MQTTAAPDKATPRQIERILELLNDGAHHKPGTITGPTTAEDIANLTHLQARVYQQSLRFPQGTTHHDVHAFTGTLKITFTDLTTGDTSWTMTLPGAPELHGTSNDINEIVKHALTAAVSPEARTDDAPHGWYIDGLTATTRAVHDGTYAMRPYTDDEYVNGDPEASIDGLVG